MSSVAPTRLSMIVPLETSRSLNCTLARRLPGVLWSALVTTNNLPSSMTAWPRRISLALMDSSNSFVFNHLRAGPSPGSTHFSEKYYDFHREKVAECSSGQSDEQARRGGS